MQPTYRIPFSRRQFAALIPAALAGFSLTRRGWASRPPGGDSPEFGSLQPVFPLTGPSHDRFLELLHYDPLKDRDAACFRSVVPRARRIPPFADTQAHPRLSPQPQLASLTGCYRGLGMHDDNRYKTLRYGTPPAEGVYISRMVSYHDMLVNWSGVGILPNPAMTDAAHRNGVRSLGTLFQPEHRFYDSSAAPAEDVAAVLVNLSIYFGFDGYFVNFENSTPRQHSLMLEMIGMMRTEARRRGHADFYVQFYDGTSDVAGLLPPAPGTNPAPGSASYADSAMLDQGWSGYSMTRGCCSGSPVTAQDVHQYCVHHGLSPFQAFFGYQLYPGPGYLGLSAPDVIHPNDGAYAYGSLQTYSWDDGLAAMAASYTGNEPWFQSQADGIASGPERFYALERHFFSGQTGNPALNNTPDATESQAYAEVAGGTRRYTGYTPGSTRHTDQMRLPITYGVANFIVEHSVIETLPFVSHFNVGSGQGFYLQGVCVSRTPWFNMGAQELLPTWQWWTEPMHAPLDPASLNPSPLAIRYDHHRVFDGGSSLRVTGVVPAPGVALRLYKTACVLQGSDPVLQAVWQGGGALHRRLHLGLVFAERPDTVHWTAFSQSHVTHAAAAGEWIRTTFPLLRYRGQTLASIVLGFSRAGGSDAGQPLDVHFGEVYLGPMMQPDAPAAPAGFTCEAHTACVPGQPVEARLRWTLDPGIAFYDLFATPGGQPRRWIGRIAADRFYASEIFTGEDGTIAFDVTATSHAAPTRPSASARLVLGRSAAGAAEA